MVVVIDTEEEDFGADAVNAGVKAVVG